MKIVVLDGYTENPGDLSWAGLEALGELTVYDHTQPQDVPARIAGAGAVLTNKTPLTRETILGAPALRYIGMLATGYDVVDVGAAKERGIPLCNVPSYGTQAVAQFVFALLLEVCHHVGHHNQMVQQGKWTACRDYCFWDYPLIELKGKVMGIVGYGRIGRATADIARAFGMEVVANDPVSRQEGLVSLDELLARSDVISLHCPLTADNRGMVNAGSIAKMRDGVILVNTSRGALVDEKALREALLSGKVYAAAVDVVSSEPIAADNPLLGLPNCIITPHIAWANKASRQRLMDTAVDNLASFLRGETVNSVWQ
ncbi:MAG TPA: D-2-hydroxyacid dehydrogenase [Candidatus Limnocylindria bacterium]|nr:D-2-hydroxyacid dehydrogenase [Candidatus Limnocylindria bacterium]